MAAAILPPRKAIAVLSNAIHYLHLEAQLTRTRDEFEDFSISLKLLGLLYDGWDGGPGLFNLACAYATGLPHRKYLYRRAERAEFQRLELLRAIPDYDYSQEPRIGRDPFDGRRHHGNDFGKQANRLRNLAAQASAGDDANSTRGTDADLTSADIRTGVWAGAEDCHSIPSGPRAAGEPDLPDPHRRKPPKSIRSDAQREQIASVRKRVIAGACYFGA